MTASANRVPRPRLSVAMVVRNEEQVLAASIQSVRAVADEIVVLDTGSTDRTPAIAERLGAAVSRAPWNDSFAAARNGCLGRVTGDWVLWLDAGERLDEQSAAELRQFVDRQADPGKVYLAMVKLPPANAATSGEQVARLRLAPNRADLRFEGRVRETLRPSIAALGLQIDAAPGTILRHPRQHDPARKALLADRDLRLVALEIAEQGDPSARLLLARGDAYSNLDAQKEARAAFLQAVEAAEHGSTEMLEGYYGLLSTYENDHFFRDVPLTICLEALEVFPVDTQLLLALGNHLLSQNRADLATRSFATAVGHGQVDLETWHLCELGEVAADCLCLTLQVQGKDDEARGVLEEALKCCQGSTRLQRRLMQLHIKQGRGDKAVELAGRLPAKPEQRQPLFDAVRGAAAAARRQWTAALGYLQSAYVAGCRDPICLRWLSVTLLSNGQVEAARPVLQEWQRLEPGNAELQAYLAATRPAEEIATVDSKPADQQPSSDLAGRHFRIDQGTIRLEVAPPRWPIISQTSSADLMGETGA